MPRFERATFPLQGDCATTAPIRHGWGGRRVLAPDLCFHRATCRPLHHAHHKTSVDWRWSQSLSRAPRSPDQLGAAWAHRCGKLERGPGWMPNRWGEPR